MIVVMRNLQIMEIISNTNVETQEQLLQELEDAGFRSTQATISRDIKELRIVKELTSFGTYRYTTSGKDGNIVARVDPRSKSRTNDDITVAFDVSRLHFFDKDTETTLLNR